VHRGKELADQAGASLREIVAAFGRVLSMIEQIAAGSTEQAQVAEDLSQRVESIRQVTHDTARKASESASAALELSRQAEQLQGVVALFKL
jgi:methyl-accepting chemotaxis protein